MRISNLQQMNNMVSYMGNINSKLNSTVERIAVGKKNDLSAYDKTSVLSYKNVENKLNQDIKSEKFGINYIKLQTTVLNEIKNKINDIKNLVSENLGAVPNDTFKNLFNSINAEILNFVNTKDSDGNYIFSGFKSTTKPFNDLSLYNGDNEKRLLFVDDKKIEIGIPGSEIINDDFVSAINEIQNNIINNTSVSINSFDKLESIFDNVSEKIISSSFKSIELSDSIKMKESLKNIAIDAYEDIENVNIEEEIIKLNTLKTNLEALYNTNSIMSKLSLFNYIR